MDSQLNTIVSHADKGSRDKLSWGKYSANLGHFFKEVQDINLYIEDTAKEAENFYKALIKNILPNMKIKKIFGLGGREKVIEACSKPKKQRVKELYIIDGDLYCYYLQPLKIPNLFTHNAYCVENLLIDYHAVVTFIEDSLAVNFEDAKEMCDWENFREVMLNNFNELFFLYAICHKFQLPLKTVKRFNTAEWVDHSYKKGFKPPKKETIIRTVNEVRAHIVSEIGIENFNLTHQEIKDNLEKLDDFKMLDYISGKNYSIHFLKNFIASKGCPMNSITDESLKYRLIKISKHTELIILKNAIESVIDKGEYITSSSNDNLANKSNLSISA